MSAINWEKLFGDAREKVERVFSEQFDGRSDEDLYAFKPGRKTVFARDCGGVTRLYAAGDDGRIYSLKVHTNVNNVGMHSLNELTRAAVIGLDEDAKWAGVYTNGLLQE